MSTFPPESFFPSNPVDLRSTSQPLIVHRRVCDVPDEELDSLSFRSIGISLSLFEFAEVGSLVVGSRSSDELVEVGYGVGEDDVDSLECLLDRLEIVVVRFAELDVRDAVVAGLGRSRVGRSSERTDLIACFRESEGDGSTLNHKTSSIPARRDQARRREIPWFPVAQVTATVC